MAKTKISATVDSSLMKKVDHLALGATRSEIVEKALEQWLRKAKLHALEDEIEHLLSGPVIGRPGGGRRVGQAWL